MSQSRWFCRIALGLLAGAAPVCLAVDAASTAAPAPQTAPTTVPSTAPVEDPAALAPSLVTLHLKEAKSQEVMGELARQSGNQLAADANVWKLAEDQRKQKQLPPITIDIDRQPFWVAMRDVAKQTGVGPVLWEESAARRLQLQWGGGSNLEGRCDLRNAIAVGFQSLRREHTVNLDQPQRIQRQMSISFFAMAEPRLRLANRAISARLLEAVDENGRSLMPDAGSDWSECKRQGWTWNFDNALACPADVGKRIARLRGQLRCDLVVRTDKFEVPDVLKATETSRTFGGRRYEFLSAQKNNDKQYTLRLRLWRDGRNEDQWFSLVTNVRELSSLEMDLRDAKNVPLSSHRTINIKNDEQSLEADFLFLRNPVEGLGLPEAPATFTWQVPLETKTVAMPFDFADVPIP